MNAQPETIETLVAQYVRLRDRIKEADDAHKEKTKAAREFLENLNGKLLQQLQTLGGDSIKTQAGTVYKTVKKSASIADGDVFRDFIIQTQAFDMVDWKANAGAVEDYIKSTSVPPPGVNFNMTHVVGVRRS